MEQELDQIKKNQNKQMIEFENRQLITARQRKQKKNDSAQDDMYSFFEGTVDSGANLTFTKRGTEFSIDEEFQPRHIQNPLNCTLPNLEDIQYNNHLTIEKKNDLTYNKTCQKVDSGEVQINQPEHEIYLNHQQTPEEDVGKVIQINEINYLQSFPQESNFLKISHQKKSSKVQKDFNDTLNRIQRKQIQK